MRFSTIRKLKVHNPQVTHPMMMFEEIGKKMVFAHIEWSSFQHGAANANSIYHRILHLFFDITKFLMPYNSPRFYFFCVCIILQPFCWFAPVALMMVVQRHGHTADARARGNANSSTAMSAHIVHRHVPVAVAGVVLSRRSLEALLTSSCHNQTLNRHHWDAIVHCTPSTQTIPGASIRLQVCNKKSQFSAPFFSIPLAAVAIKVHRSTPAGTNTNTEGDQ